MMRTPLRLIDQKLLSECDKVIVVGDLHGDAMSLALVLSHFNPKRDLLIFIGDYADRGKFGVEVIERIFLLLSYCPDRVIAIMGNHEDYTDDGTPRFSPCHLIDEVVGKWGCWEHFFEAVFRPFSTLLNLAALIEGEALFVHGGVSEKVISLEELRDPTREVIQDVINSDCTQRFDHEKRNSIRGVGQRFGSESSLEACRRLNVNRIFRGHQHDLGKKGPSVLHDGRIVTVISSKVLSRLPYALVLNPNAPTEVVEILWLLSGKREAASFQELLVKSLRQSVPVANRKQLTPAVVAAIDKLKRQCRTGEMRRIRSADPRRLNLPDAEAGERYVSFSLGDMEGNSRIKQPKFLALIDEHKRCLIDVYLADRVLGPESIRRIDV